MKNYYFTEDHQIFRSSVRDFLDSEIVPYIEEWEKDGQVPKTVFKKMGDMGFYSLGFEEKFGGVKTDLFYLIILVEELNKCNSGGTAASLLLAHSTLAMEHIASSNSDKLKEKYLIPGIKGDITGCLAISEPHAGSDVANIKTKAEKKWQSLYYKWLKNFHHEWSKL